MSVRARIHLALFVGLAAVTSLGHSTSPPPPPPPTLEDHVRNADAIVLGEVVSFYFKGISNDIPAEYERIFDKPGRSRNLYVVIRNRETLLNELPTGIPASIRIAAAFPSNDYESFRDQRLIFFLRRPYWDPSKDGDFQAFPLATKPVELQELNKVRKLIAATQRKTN